MSLGTLNHMHKVNSGRSERAGLIWLAVNWDHKQAVAIMVMKI